MWKIKQGQNIGKVNGERVTEKTIPKLPKHLRDSWEKSGIIYQEESTKKKNDTDKADK